MSKNKKNWKRKLYNKNQEKKNTYETQRHSERRRGITQSHFSRATVLKMCGMCVSRTRYILLFFFLLFLVLLLLLCISLFYVSPK